ncbi:hypothetical protein BASA61_007708 [Batrachochytrium salamandrivorans]|nr:hypothetical protein BASA61_007708 [Batrachochytrium salamandrivorans]
MPFTPMQECSSAHPSLVFFFTAQFKQLGTASIPDRVDTACLACKNILLAGCQIIGKEVGTGTIYEVSPTTDEEVAVAVEEAIETMTYRMTSIEVRH